MKLLLVGEYDPSFAQHRATNEALRHAADALGLQPDVRWVSTADFHAGLDRLNAAGVLAAPGSPYKSLAGMLTLIRFCREHDVPLLGTCGGFQHMILEYARNVLGFTDAEHAEYDPNASRLFIARLACSLVGRTLTVRLAASSRVAEIYGARTAQEQYYCNFGVAPEHVSALASGPLRITGSDDEGEVRVIELPGHPFFLGTLYVPQFASRPGAPHPLMLAFLRAAQHTVTHHS